MQPPRLFVSHSWKDKFFVNKLAEQLVAKGVDVWVDSAELKVGDSLMQSVSKAIEECDHFAIVLSHSSVSSGWVSRELQLAMNLILERKSRRILPILIEKCEVPLFLRDLVYADFTDTTTFDSSLQRVLHALGVVVMTAVVSAPPRAMPPAIPNPASGVSTPLSTFQDIHIVDVDKQRTYKPDEEMALYHVYLRLSATPASEWTEIFDVERQFPRHSMWRRAWIESDSIIVHCVPEEIKKYHLHDLKDDVDNCNRKYREHLMKLERQKARQAQIVQREKSMLDDALGGLDL